MGAIIIPWMGREVTAAPPVTREWFPGHYIVVGNGSGRRGTYHIATGGASTDLLRLPGVTGILLRWSWPDIETSPGVFDFGDVLASYPSTDHSIRADLWRCAQANSHLIVLLEDKTFDGSHVTPSDIRGAAYEQQWFNGGNTGYTAARWNTTIVDRWGAFIQAVGAEFADDPTFHGLAFPETATSLTSSALTASGYDQEDYRDAMIAQLTTASDAIPLKRVFWFHNFMPTIAQDVHLDSVCDAIVGFKGGSKANGILLGGPDILPDPVERAPNVWSDAVTERCQPRYLEYFGEIDLFCSMQNDSYRNIHRGDIASGQTVTDPRMPGYSWTSGTTWSMDDMFVFSRDFLQLQYIFWNFLVASSGQEWEPHGRTTVGANPTFNTDL
jgi:hypothetical protein